jgi:hypothetical protein
MTLRSKNVLLMLVVRLLDLDVSKVADITNASCNRHQERVNRKSDKAQKELNKYNFELNKNIAINQQEIDKIKNASDMIIKAVLQNRDTKIRNILTVNDIFINRKNSL